MGGRILLDGSQASRGKYISLFGQDDVKFPKRISTLVDALQNYKVGTVCSNAYYVCGDESSQDLVCLQFRKSRPIERHLFPLLNPIIGFSALYRKDNLYKIYTIFFFSSEILKI